MASPAGGIHCLHHVSLLALRSALFPRSGRSRCVLLRGSLAKAPIEPFAAARLCHRDHRRRVRSQQTSCQSVDSWHEDVRPSSMSSFAGSLQFIPGLWPLLQHKTLRPCRLRSSEHRGRDWRASLPPSGGSAGCHLQDVAGVRNVSDVQNVAGLSGHGSTSFCRHPRRCLHADSDVFWPLAASLLLHQAGL